MIQKAPISMIMTKDVITLKTTDSLETAELVFKRHKIRHIPIVDHTRIKGMLSYTDVLRLSFADITDVRNHPADTTIYSMLTISQVMTQNIVSVSSTKSIKQVAEVFAVKEFHALPVVDKNVLKGIVTTTDLIKYLIAQF